MELAHTEGPLFYAGWDGFMEEYAAQTFDPMVVDSTGTIQPNDAFFNVKKILETASYISNNANTPSNIIDSDMGVRMSMEMERVKRINAENKNYYSNLFKSFFKSPIVKGAAKAFFGESGQQGLNLLDSFVETFQNPSSYENAQSDWLGSQFGSGVSGGSIRKGSATNMHNSAEVKDYASSRHAAIRNIIEDHAMHTKNRLNGGALLKPILDRLKAKSLRKKMHDIHDEVLEAHGLKEKIDPMIVPKCGHCESTKNLHVMKDGKPETVCEGCKKGSGITQSRRIITDKNSEPLALHDPKSSHSRADLRSMSENYNKFIRIGKSPKEEKPKDSMQPVNYQWRHFKHTARPHFKHDPDHIIHSLSTHKMREPLNMSQKHILKNTALMAGKLHSMMNVERKTHHPDHLENLKHNYHWHVAHLPDKKGKPFRPFKAHHFEEMAAGISENPHQLKTMSNSVVSNNFV
jgi:hypothetical protein